MLTVSAACSPFLFQFTPLREGRHRRARTPALAPCDFNSRPSARGDGCHRIVACLYTHFNSRPSARGDPPSAECADSATYFNSRPSARGDWGTKKSFSWCFISIHAPPRGATEVEICPFEAVQFQFTPLREGRLAIIWRWMCRSYFNSRPSARGDAWCSATSETVSLFQFTPLREGRHAWNAFRLFVEPISIHAPPRGATGYADSHIFPAAGISIHAPPRGATRPRRSCRRRRADFNSRPSARGDPN